MLTLAEIAETKLLDDLFDCIETESRRATLACDGVLQFTGDLTALASASSSTKGSETESTEGSDEVSVSSKASISTGDYSVPVDIRFGKSGEGMTSKLPEHSGSSKEFRNLLNTCQPASFGVGSKEVLNEEYRKAGKLDRAAFATTFCPYESGIINFIAQFLVP